MTDDEERRLRLRVHNLEIAVMTLAGIVLEIAPTAVHESLDRLGQDFFDAACSAGGCSEPRLIHDVGAEKDAHHD